MKESHRFADFDTSLWSDFKKRHYDGSHTFTQPNKEAKENYQEVFLSHAKLYALAKMWLVEDLEKLSLMKLQRTLSSFTLHEERLPDIVSLLEFAFNNEHTHDREPGGDLDDLRSLVAHYAACNIKQLMKNKQFLELLEVKGAVGRDILEYLMKYKD